MSELIPPFDWQTVVVSTWTENASHYGWMALMGFLVATTCGLIGNYLILRRMALVGDAISHSVLPGLAIAYILVNIAGAGADASGLESHGSKNAFAMFAGALVAAMVTTIMIELIHKKTRVKQDAAIGITFSSLFALGVVIISLFAGKAHIDTDCVLHGELTFVPIDVFVSIGGRELAPMPVVRMAIVAGLTLLLIILFYKELLVSSFDSGLAASLGINSTVMHYGLMCWLSVVVVSSFEAVGAILVIAMLIIPGATASLLTRRLPWMMGLTVVHAALSSVLGLHLAIWLECSVSGAMCVAGAGLFVMVWVFSPSEGLIQLWLKSRREPPLEVVEAEG
jgi:manganese/zinc/iron transport system permease protein